MGKSDESVFVTKLVERLAYAFQVSVNHPIGVKIVEATCDAKELSIGDKDRAMPHRKAGELTRFMRSGCT